MRAGVSEGAGRQQRAAAEQSSHIVPAPLRSPSRRPTAIAPSAADALVRERPRSAWDILHPVTAQGTILSNWPPARDTYQDGVPADGADASAHMQGSVQMTLSVLTTYLLLCLLAVGGMGVVAAASWRARSPPPRRGAPAPVGGG